MAILPDLQNEPAMHSLDVPMANLTVNNKFNKAVEQMAFSVQEMIGESKRKEDAAELQLDLAEMNKWQIEVRAATSNAKSSQEREAIIKASDFTSEESRLHFFEYMNKSRKESGRSPLTSSQISNLMPYARAAFQKEYNHGAVEQFKHSSRKLKDSLIFNRNIAAQLALNEKTAESGLRVYFLKEMERQTIESRSGLAKSDEKVLKKVDNSNVRAIISKFIKENNSKEVEILLKKVAFAAGLSDEDAIKNGLMLHKNIGSTLQPEDFTAIKKEMSDHAKGKRNTKLKASERKQLSKNFKSSERINNSQANKAILISDIGQSEYIQNEDERREAIYKLAEEAVRNEALLNTPDTLDSSTSFSDKEAKKILDNLQRDMIEANPDNKDLHWSNLNLQDFKDILQEEKKKIAESSLKIESENSIGAKMDQYPHLTRDQAIEQLKREGKKVTVVSQEDIEAAIGNYSKFSELLDSNDVKQNMQEFKKQITSMRGKVSPIYQVMVDETIAGVKDGINETDYPIMTKEKIKQLDDLIKRDNDRSKVDKVEAKYDNQKGTIAKLLHEHSTYRGTYESMVQSRTYWHMTQGIHKGSAKEALKAAKEDVNKSLEERYSIAKVDKPWSWIDREVIVLNHEGGDKEISRGGKHRGPRTSGEIAKKNIYNLSEDIISNPKKYLSGYQASAVERGDYEIVIKDGLDSGEDFSVKLRDKNTGKEYEALKKSTFATKPKLIIDRDFVEKWGRETKNGSQVNNFKMKDY